MAQALIAVRGGGEAKSRCSDLLAPADRDALTAAMLEDMLAAVARCADVSATWVVTPTDRLADLAVDHGSRVVRQPEPAELNAAFTLALAEVRERAPYEAVMLMPGDLPAINPSDLTAAILLARTHAVVLAPSHDGGTGLVGLRAGVAMTPEFGPASFSRHAAAAVRQRHSLAVLSATSFMRDVDRPEDLVRLLELGLGERTTAFVRARLPPRVAL